MTKSSRKAKRGELGPTIGEISMQRHPSVAFRTRTASGLRKSGDSPVLPWGK